MSIKLRIINGDNERYHEIHQHESLVVLGRHATCDVVLDDEKRSSRHHCQIERQADGTFLLRDLKSSNGTRLGKTAVYGAVPLSLGDKIRIGETTIYFGEPPIAVAPVRRPADAVGASAAGSDKSLDRDMRRAEATLARGGGHGLAIGLGVAALVAFAIGLGVVLSMAPTSPGPGPLAGDRAGSQTPDTPQAQRPVVDDPAGTTDGGGLYVPDFAAIQAEREERERAMRQADALLSGDVPLAERVDRFEALLLAHREAPFYPTLLEKQAGLYRGIGQSLDRMAEAVIAEVDAERRRFRFAAALRRLHDGRSDVLAAADAVAAYADRFDTNWPTLLRQALEHLNAQAYQVFIHQIDPAGIDLLQQAQSHLSAGDREEATAAIDAATDHYRRALAEHFIDRSATPARVIDSVAAQIDMQLHDLQDLRDAVAHGDAAELAAVARRMRERNADEREAGPTEGLGDVRPARRPDPLADRESELLATLHKRLIDACNQENGFELIERRVRFAGRDAVVHSATEENITIRLGGSRTIQRWRAIQPELMLALYDSIQPRTIDDNFAIAVYAFDHDLPEAAERVLYNVLRRDNAHQDAVDVFLSRRRDIDIPDGGFVAFEGRVVTPDERDAVVVARRIDTLMTQIERIDPASRRRMQAAQEAIEELSQYSPEVRSQAVGILMARKDEQQARLANYGFGANSQLDSLKARLDEARAEALAMIYDEEAYPYPNPNKMGQAKVDTLVGKVRQIWEDPAAVVTDRVDPRVGAMVDRIRFLLDMAQQLDPDGQILSGNEEQEFLDWVQSLVNQALSIQNYSTDPSERRMYADHALVAIDNHYGESEATSDERQHVRLVNSYRVMMGRPAVRINSNLTQASRAHSQYMQATGQFAHNIPGHPDGASPADRARRFNYGSPDRVGENIAMNSNGHNPTSSFVAWYNSSGHHRNMLRAEWRVLGAGSVGTHWTQKFGATTDGSEPRAEGTFEPLPNLPIPVGAVPTAGRPQ